MIIKFSKDIELDEWLYLSGSFVWIRVYGNDRRTGVCILQSIGIEEYHCKFYSDLTFLNQLYTGPNYLNSSEELKMCIDNFLIKMNKLRAFI